MKKHSFVIIIALFSFSLTSKAQWEEMTTPAVYFEDISVVSQDICYAISYWATTPIIKTLDGGNTWDTIQVKNESNQMTTHYSIQFLTEDTGFVGGMYQVDGGSFAGGYEATRIYKTVNGGLSWDDISPPEDSIAFGQVAQYFYFFDELRAIAIDNRKYWITADGGLSWTSGTFPAISIVDVNFDPSGQGYIVGKDRTGTLEDQAFVIFIEDFGATWSYNTIDNPNTRLGDVQRIDDSTVYAITHSSILEGLRMFKSFDNGITWDTIILPTKTYDMHFFNKSEGFILAASSDSLKGNSQILKTSDGGETWSVDFTLSSYGPRTMEFNGNDGYMYNDFGRQTMIAKFTGDVLSVKNKISDTEGGIYPNPVKDKLYFDLPDFRSTSIKVYNCTGGLVEDKIINQPYLNTSNYQPGVYFLLLSLDGRSNSYKFIKD